MVVMVDSQLVVVTVVTTMSGDDNKCVACSPWVLKDLMPKKETLVALTINEFYPNHC